MREAGSAFCGIGVLLVTPGCRCMKVWPGSYLRHALPTCRPAVLLQLSMNVAGTCAPMGAPLSVPTQPQLSVQTQAATSNPPKTLLADSPASASPTIPQPSAPHLCERLRAHGQCGNLVGVIIGIDFVHLWGQRVGGSGWIAPTRLQL